MTPLARFTHMRVHGFTVSEIDRSETRAVHPAPIIPSRSRKQHEMPAHGIAAVWRPANGGRVAEEIGRECAWRFERFEALVTDPTLDCPCVLGVRRLAVALAMTALVAMARGAPAGVRD